MATVNKGILTRFYTDADGNVISIKVNNEQKSISSINYTITLDGIPEEFNRVICVSKNTGEILTEVNSLSALQEGCFYVDYQLGKVYFNSTEAGKVVLFSYYSQGYELISSSRVFDESAYEENNIIKTIQDIIDAGRKGLDYLENIGQGDALVQQLKDEVTIANNCYTTLKATVDRGDTLNTSLQNNITSATEKNTTLLNNLSTVDSKNSTLTTTINSARTTEGSLNTTIDTAKSTNSTLTNSINTGNTLNTNLKDTTTKANQALSDLNTAVNASDLSKISGNVTNLLKYSVVVGTLAELETAIANIGRAGYSGHILIKAGTYTPTKSYELPSFTHIEPLGDGEVIFKCNTTSINNIFRNKLTGTEGEYNGSKLITIEGITFDGFNTTHEITVVSFAHSYKSKVCNCTFKNFNAWHSIEFNSCSYSYADHCKFMNYGNTSGGNPTEVIQLDYAGNSSQYPWTCKYDNTHCSNIYIKNCIFENINGTCVGNHSFASGNHIKYLFIEENKFKNCKNCVKTGDVDNLNLINNSIEGCKYFFDAQVGSGETLFNLFIHKNYFYGLKGTSGYTDRTVDNRFVTVYCLNENNFASYNKITITDNQVDNCNTYGISIFGYNVTCNNNIVNNSGNIGIYFPMVWKGTINGNTSEGNGTYGQGWRNYDIAVGGYSGGRNSWKVNIVGNVCSSICGLNGCTADNYASANTCDVQNVNGGALTQR